jgi:hypothetical protein
MKQIPTETAVVLSGTVFVVCWVISFPSATHWQISLISNATYKGTVPFIKESYSKNKLEN